MEIRELENKIIELTNRVEKLEKEKTQKHEFKVGDRVQFKSWEEMEREFGIISGNIATKITFVPEMKFLCGTYATIKEIKSDGKVILTDSTSNQGNIGDWNYSLDMLKPAVNEPKHWNFTEDEKVILRNLPEEFKWIARDDYKDDLYIYTGIPEKEKDCDYWFYNGKDYSLREFKHLFQTIQWEDNEPCEFRKFI